MNALQIANSQTKTVSDYINSFLKSMSVESKHTMIAYENSIKEFFKDTRNKSIDELVIGDLSYTYMEVEEYRNSLIGTLKNSTINSRMTAVKVMFDKLSSYGLVVNNTPFGIKKLKEYDSDSYGTLSFEEVQQAVQIASELRDGVQKSLLLKLAFATAFRKNSLLELKWSNIYTDNGNYLIKTLGKGNKWSVKKLDENTYFELLEYKKTIEPRDKVFSLSSSTVQRMIDAINKKMDFGDRNITFHSFKKASIEEVGRQTGYDIKAMQRHGDHSDVTTTLNIYVEKKDIENMPTVSVDKENIDLRYLNSLTKEEIIGIIELLDRETKLEIVGKAKRSVR